MGSRGRPVLLVCILLSTHCNDLSVVSPGEGVGAVSGTIRDPDGALLGNVNVFVRGNLALFSASDAGGSFSLEDIPAGQHEIIAYSEAGWGALVPVTVFGGQLMPLEVQLAPSATISGRVQLAGAVDRGVSLVRLLGTPFVAATGQDGAFAIAHVAPGCYELWAEHEDYSPLGLERICVTAGQTRAIGELTLLPQTKPECSGDQDCGLHQWCDRGSCSFEAGFEAEQCDGRDNDGNGLVDDALVQLCGSDEGTCSVGIRLCLAAEWTDCQGAVQPLSELCGDGLDNDCDGTTDEDCP